MADYSKWKVTELKAEIKRRGVPQTGLKLKQNFIDKLLELDAETQGGDDTADYLSEQSNGQQGTEGREDEEDPALTQQHEEGGRQMHNVPKPQEEPSEFLEKSQQPQEESMPMKETIEDAKPGQGDVADQAIPHPDQPAVSYTTAMETPRAVTETIDSETPDTKETAEISEPTADTQTIHEPSVLPVAEAVDDMRKRKRRSQSPPPSTETVKKAKSDNQHPGVILQEDVGSDNTPQRSASIDNHSAAAAVPPESHLHQSKIDLDSQDADGELRPTLLSQTEENKGSTRQDARFKGLFEPTQERRQPSSPRNVEETEERQIEPALHPATSAIYIRNFMRPLQPVMLKNHLVSLASPIGTSLNPNIVVDFFLDSIKTHGFIRFASVSAASRVRSALHGAVWPNERDRKPLWVDFVPEDKLSDWIRVEQEPNPRTRGGIRWGVVYNRTRDGIEAVLRESRSANTAPAPSHGRDDKQTIPIMAPSGPHRSADMGIRRDSQISDSLRQRGGEGFKALDELFRSTQAKPKLYYLPVRREVAEKRLDRFSTLARHGPRPRRGGDEMRRISFEDTDQFVDNGPEYGAPPGRGRRRGGGSWRGRGY